MFLSSSEYTVGAHSRRTSNAPAMSAGCLDWTLLALVVACIASIDQASSQVRQSSDLTSFRGKTELHLLQTKSHPMSSVARDSAQFSVSSLKTARD